MAVSIVLILRVAKQLKEFWSQMTRRSRESIEEVDAEQHKLARYWNDNQARMSDGTASTAPAEVE